MNEYFRWLYGNNCGCGCDNNYKKIEDCDCDQILLDISNIKTDIIKLSGDIVTDLSDYYTKEEIDILLPTNVSELVNDAGYITTAALADYALKTDIPTSNSAFTNDAGYLTEHQHLKTINGQSLVGEGNIVIEGSGTSVTIDEHLDSGSTNPVANSAVTEALNGKLDASGYSPTDLSDYYTKQEVNNLIPTVPTSNSAFTNDMHYLTSADTANYVTSGTAQTMINNHFYCCSEAEWSQISGSAQNNVLYLIY